MHPMRARSFVRALLALVLLPPAHALAQAAPDPIWSGTQPNTWLYADPTSPPVPVRIGPAGTRSERVTNTSPGLFELLLSLGGTVQVAGASPYAILVNQVRGSSPTPAQGPALVVTGYGQAAFAEVGGALVGPGGVPPTSYVRFRPGSGSYTRSAAIVFDTMSLEPVTGVSVRVLHDGAWVDNVQAPSGALRPLPQGTSEIYWSVAIGAAIYTGVETYLVHVPLVVDSDGDLIVDSFLDEDGDGVPDAVELAYGGHPGEADLGADRDRDGMSDFDEWLRGSDPACAPPTPNGAATPCFPLDSDNDGWSDWDETARGTTVGDKACRPSAAGLLEPELIIASPVHDAGLTADATVASVGGIDLVGLDWSARDVRGGAGCELGFTPGPAAPDGTTRRTLAGMVLRVAAGAPALLRSTGPAWNAADIKIGQAGWVGLAFLTASNWATPDRIVAQLSAPTTPSAADFRAAYQEAFTQLVVGDWYGRVSPRAVLPATLLADLAAWHAELGDGLRPVLGLTTGAATSAMHEVMDRADNITSLLVALDAFFAPGAPLAGETAPFTTLLGATTNEPVDQRFKPSALGRYLARLHLVAGVATVVQLTPSQRASLFDPNVDFDGDGLTSKAELVERGSGPTVVTPTTATDPTRADSDGDLALDGADPCPNDALDDCLVRQAAQQDSDGDGVIDALDNCLNTANASQSDGNGDGLGDACSGLAYITQPRVHPVVRTGSWLHFESQLGKLGFESTGLTYRWTFGGLAPDQTAAQPSGVFIARPGTYRVELKVGATGRPEQVIDFRNVTVIGPTVVLEVAIEVTGATTEGVRLTFNGYAQSPAGTITGISWSMGDGTTLNGTTVRQTYAQQGSRTITATATDNRGLTGSASVTLDIADTVPVARFDSQLDRLSLTLTDTSTAYDTIASRTWNLGDGGPVQTAPTVNYTYAAAGRYTVELTVVDGDGSTKTAKRTIIADGKNVQRLSLDIDDDWQVVALPYTMVDPIIVPGVVNPSLAGTSGVVRVGNVGPATFEVRFEAWPSMPLVGMALPVDILAVERGSHRFADGSRWQADSTPLDGDNGSFTFESFGAPVSAVAPALLLTSVQTANETAPLGARVRSFSATGFEVALMQREVDAGLMRSEEEVGFLAIWAPVKKGKAIINGANASWVSAYFKLGTARKASGNCILALAEETSFDAETAHVNENVWLLRVLNGCWASVVSNLEIDPVVIERR